MTVAASRPPWCITAGPKQTCRASRSHLSRPSFLWATIVVALLAYAICSIRWEWEGTVASAFTMVPPWCFFVFACTRFARASFYFYQVKMRALVSLKTWFSDPGAWLSGPARAIGLALLVALALTPLAPHVAMADTSTPISATNVVSQLANATQSGDLSFQWMNRLFPGTVEFWFLSAGSTSTPSTSTDVLQALFQVLNSVLFALAAGMLSWHTVNGLVASAHTGKPLGDRWHTIWAPLRVVWGIGNLAPVKGYCMAQILVINLLLGGYSLANLEWQTYVDEITSPTGAMIVPPRIDATKSLVNNLVRAETCWQTL